MKSRTLFLTYGQEPRGGGDAKYHSIRQAARRLTDQAMSTGVFSKYICCEGVDILRASHRFGLQYPNLEIPHLFKPYLMNLAYMGAFESAKEFDFIFYTDAGSEICSNHFAKRDYFRMLRIADRCGIYAEGTRYRELSWSKKELVERTGATSEILDSGQIQAGLLVISMSSKHRDRMQLLLELWLRLANEGYISEEYDPQLQDLRFLAPRHDQSILSLLLKKLGFQAQRERRRGFGKPFAALRGARTFAHLARNRSGESRFSKNQNNYWVGVLSLIVSPLLRIYDFLEDAMGGPAHYSNFDEQYLSRKSRYPM